MKIEKKPSKKVLYVVAAIVLAVAAVGFAYFYFHNKNTTNTAQKTSTESTTTEKNQTNGGGITSSKDDDSSDSPAPSPDAGIMPVKPSGTFVSNHRPNLSGTPAPNTITSTCTTTPGSQCTIRFTNGSTSLSLPSKSTDGNGNVNWTWKLQDIGLTAGAWKITAIATNGSHSAEESDALDLIIEE